MGNNAITFCGVSKSYNNAGGRILALDNVSFDVERGSIFGLVGPDGAGKTTLMRIATTLILPDSGNAEICGLDIKNDYKAIREKIGYMPNKFSLYQDLTIEENLAFFAKIFGVNLRENMELIGSLYSQIEPFKNRLAGKLSGGMKQKLALCCALIHRPEILVLDEPTTGVDPVSRQELWEILAKMRDKNITIFVSTPYMDEASLCDKTAFIASGKILKIDSPANIVKSFSSKIYHAEGADMFALLKILRGFSEIKSAYSFGDKCHFVLRGCGDIKKLECEIAKTVCRDSKIVEAIPTLEDCFMLLQK